MMESVFAARYVRGIKEGFYESYLIRANHPTEPYAFSIRYTVMSPRQRPEEAVGELQGIWFDGETGQHRVVNKSLAIDEVEMAKDRLMVRIGGASLDEDKVAGEGASENGRMAWQLSYRGQQKPLFLLPPAWYEKGFPRAKSLVILPLAKFDGSLEIDGAPLSVNGWVGSVNHHWGVKYTDEYAWGQVAGFDGAEESFLEMATACLRWGPFRTPYVTPVVLRHRGEEFAFNTFFNLCDSRGSFSDYVWVFRAEKRGVRIEGTVSAPRESFAGFTYRNPPGGVKYGKSTCLAACEMKFEDKRGKRAFREALFTRHRAAFEILTPRPSI